VDVRPSLPLAMKPSLSRLWSRLEEFCCDIAARSPISEVVSRTGFRCAPRFRSRRSISSITDFIGLGRYKIMELTFGNLRMSVPDDVYNPAEDSFMLAKAAGGLRGEILEVGTGSGLSALCAAVASHSHSVLGVAIHHCAVRCATDNAKANRIKNASFIISDLFSAVPAKKFDAIIFN